jgi:hypothetical protein
MARKILLICGIASSVLYVAMNIIAPLRYPGYDSFSRTVSELSAIGAPSRPLWLVLGTVYGLLLIAFGVGVWHSAGRKRALRVVGLLMAGYGLFGLAWPPMHQRAVLAAGGKTLTDTLHLVWTAVTVLIMFVFIGFGAAAFGTQFRLYSIGTVAMMLVFGVLTSMDASRVQADLPTPWAGVWERINIFSCLLWIAVLALALLRRKVERPGTIPGAPTVAPSIARVHAPLGR